MTSAAISSGSENFAWVFLRAPAGGEHAYCLSPACLPGLALGTWPPPGSQPPDGQQRGLRLVPAEFATPLLALALPPETGGGGGDGGRFGRLRPALALPWEILNPHAASLAVVVAHCKEDLSWLRQHAVARGSVHVCSKLGCEDPAPLRTDPRCTVTSNRGFETSSFLAFIVAYYDNLPPYVAFLHGSPHDWHYQPKAPKLSLVDAVVSLNLSGADCVSLNNNQARVSRTRRAPLATTRVGSALTALLPGGGKCELSAPL